MLSVAYAPFSFNQLQRKAHVSWMKDASNIPIFLRSIYPKKLGKQRADALRQTNESLDLFISRIP